MLRTTDDVFEQAKPVTRQMLLLLKDGNIRYSVALTALAKVMLEIAINGLGMPEQEARALLASFFILDDQRN